jgi:hypothetical protein
MKTGDVVDYFKWFGSWIPNYESYTCNIKSRIVMVKQHSTRRTLLHQQIFEGKAKMCHYVNECTVHLVMLLLKKETKHKYITKVSLHIMYTAACFDIRISLPGSFVLCLNNLHELLKLKLL